MSALKQALEQLCFSESIRETGRITRIAGNLLESSGPVATVGETCEIIAADGRRIAQAEVIGFRDKSLILMPMQEVEGVGPGASVVRKGLASTVSISDALIGRVLNGKGEPIDAGPVLPKRSPKSLHSSPPHPLIRRPVDTMLYTGVRAIDAFISIGRGQRVGIMAGSGVGKSYLMAMIARHAEADVNVIALIGERGREVAEFIQHDLGQDGLRRSVVVVVTSDEMPLLRKKGALLATAIAEYFRDQGKHVILLMDSLTRVAMAQREIGLAVGEPPTTKGYTPSTFSLLPRLLERAGNGENGSITGFYTVLVEGDDLNDPVADTARSILDGHIVLARELAARGHFPAIDVLQSVSRVMPLVVSAAHQDAARTLRELLAQYRAAEDLINIGAYKNGTNPRIDRAIKVQDGLVAFLRQRRGECTGYKELLMGMQKLASQE